MKKFLLLPLVLAIGFAILILLGSDTSGGGDKKEEGDVFAVDDGDYVTTDSGLKYRDIKVGDGKEAGMGSSVVVHYTGWLTDGKKFDSSRDRKEPFEFSIGEPDIIRGWSEGVTGMKVGGKRKLIIPSKLGYGARGRAPKIPPNADLVFVIELLDIK